MDNDDPILIYNCHIDYSVMHFPADKYDNYSKIFVIHLVFHIISKLTFDIIFFEEVIHNYENIIFIVVFILIIRMDDEVLYLDLDKMSNT